MHRFGRITCAIALGAVILVLGGGVAYAYDESTTTIPPMVEENCVRCHSPFGYSVFHGSTAIGVHGSYTSTTNKCASCHSVHVASPTGFSLLPGATIKASCESCHDGTGGGGVYGTIAARGLTVAAEHSVEMTTVVPGGSAADGGSAVYDFGGINDTLTCTDCHSPMEATSLLRSRAIGTVSRARLLACRRSRRTCSRRSPA
ncbi:MAG: cytochrome c3 family protein [Coriobacteriia bacterium]